MPETWLYVNADDPAIGKAYEEGRWSRRDWEAAMEDQLASGASSIKQDFPWVKWDGNYIKQFYDVLVDKYNIVLHCWPNAGKMCAMDGSGRMFEPQNVLAVRLSEFQDLPSHSIKESG